MAHPTAATSAMDASKQRKQEGDPEYFVRVCVLAQLSSVEILVRGGSSRILATHRGVLPHRMKLDMVCSNMTTRKFVSRRRGRL